VRRSLFQLAVVVAVGVVAALVAPAGPVTPATASGSTSKVAYQKMPDGRSLVARWNPCQVITYRVNPYVFPNNNEARAVRDVHDAVKRVSAATGIKFRYAGLTGQIPRNTSSKRWHQSQTSAELVIAWVDQTRSTARTDLLSRSGSGYAAGTGGYAYKYWKVGKDPWKGATGRGFVVLDYKQDKKFLWGFGKGVTRGSLLLHEIGHSLGLLHVGSTSQTMYPTVLWRSSTQYFSGDAAALKKVGRSAGCVSVPSWVWSDLK
jgi:hypothetical protein